MFESALSSRSRNPRRWAAFPAAVGIHLTALVVVVGADYWTVKPVGLPETNAVFVTFTTPSIPPAAPAGPAGRPEPVRPEPVRPEQPVQPALDEIEDLAEPEIHPSTAPVTDLDAAGPSGPGVPGGSENGSQDGIPGGMDNGDPNSTSLLPGSGPVAPLAAPSGPMVITAKVKKPEIITRVDPVYTEAARRVKTQGAVILEAVIDERGNVVSVRVLKGLPMGLEKSAIDAVSRWRFKPATLDGRPVAVYFNLTVNFQVQ